MKNKLLLLAMGLALTTQIIIAQVPSYIPTSGLVGYWPLDGSTINWSAFRGNYHRSLLRPRGAHKEAFSFFAIGTVLLKVP